MLRRKENFWHFAHDKIRLVEASDGIPGGVRILAHVRGITSQRSIPGGIIELAREE